VRQRWLTKSQQWLGPVELYLRCLLQFGVRQQSLNVFSAYSVVDVNNGGPMKERWLKMSDGSDERAMALIQQRSDGFKMSNGSDKRAMAPIKERWL
jgi:hypothetical protein